jgi:thymidylate synthase
MLRRILEDGTDIHPRGLECKEIEDLQLFINPNLPFMSFEARKYPVNYFKKEMMWKLSANKYNESIKAEAKMWAEVQNPDGTFNSNYGQYWFGEQKGIWDVVTELVRDQDSRKAVIPMLNVSHMSPQTIDTVCTESVGFRIRKFEDRLYLNMSVHMRSSDVIFGLGTDIPTFSFLYRLVKGLIQPVYEEKIFTGSSSLKITSMSSHLYARHYDVVKRIIDSPDESYESILMPHCDYAGALKIIASRGRADLLTKAGTLGVWLCE